MKTCPVCGQSLNNDASFCVSCGSPINRDSSSEMPTMDSVDMSQMNMSEVSNGGVNLKKPSNSASSGENSFSQTNGQSATQYGQASSSQFGQTPPQYGQVPPPQYGQTPQYSQVPPPQYGQMPPQYGQQMPNGFPFPNMFEDKAKVWEIILSILIPLVGWIMGGVARSNGRVKAGNTMIILGFVGFFINLILRMSLY